MHDPLESLLGLARKCGKLVAGFDEVANSISTHRAKLVLIAGDAAERTARNIKRICESADVPVYNIQQDKITVGHAVGMPPTGIISLIDAGFANKARLLVHDNKED